MSGAPALQIWAAQRRQTFAFAVALTATLSGCAEVATLPLSAGTGPRPSLSEAAWTLGPTLNIAPASGWPKNTTPVAAPGLRVDAFASGLDNPRWLYVLPDGDVLVAETNAPPQPGDGKVLKGWLMR